MDLVDPKLEAYCIAHSVAESAHLAALAATTRGKTQAAGMMVGPLEGAFLRMLVRATAAKRVLEVGTFTGYSALWMAEALPADGEVVTVDVDEATNAIAREHWQKSPHGGKIRPVLGDARAVLATLRGPFDLAFVDADKPSYAAYWDTLIPLVRPGGLVVADNVLWSGAVLKPGRDENARALAAFNTKVAADPRVEVVMLPVRDGVTVAVKL